MESVGTRVQGVRECTRNCAVDSELTLSYVAWTFFSTFMLVLMSSFGLSILRFSADFSNRSHRYGFVLFVAVLGYGAVEDSSYF